MLMSGSRCYVKVNDKLMIWLPILTKRSKLERKLPESLMAGFSWFVHAIGGGVAGCTARERSAKIRMLEKCPLI